MKKIDINENYTIHRNNSGFNYISKLEKLTQDELIKIINDTFIPINNSINKVFISNNYNNTTEKVISFDINFFDKRKVYDLDGKINLGLIASHFYIGKEYSTEAFCKSYTNALRETFFRYFDYSFEINKNNIDKINIYKDTLDKVDIIYEMFQKYLILQTLK